MSKSSKKANRKKQAAASAAGASGKAATSRVTDWAGSPATPDAAPGIPERELRPEEMTARLGTIKAPLTTPYKPGTLSVVMIAKNEAANIKDAVESFRSIADEIIVYDTGSTDGTQGILASLGVKWIQGEWRDDFAWARNQVIDQARCAWILWMDADDRIPADQLENFRKLKTAPMDRAFGFQVINTQGGRPLGGRFMQIRMFPNHPRLRFRFRIHEQVFHAIAQLGLHCFYTETTLHHTGYEDPALKDKKARRNLALLEKETERLAAEPALSMSVGDSYYIIGEFEKGIEAYKRTMEMPNCEKINRDIYRELPCCIGQGYQKLGRREEAIAWFDRSIGLQPAKHEPYFYKAQCLLEMGREAEAETLYRKLVDMPVSFSTTSNNFDLVMIYSAYHLARFAMARGGMAEAKARLEDLDKRYPDVIEGLHLLGRCHAALGDPEAALARWDRALGLNPRAIPDMHLERLALLKRLGRSEAFAEARALAARTFPHNRFPEWDVPAAPAPAPAAPGDQVTSQLRPALSLCMIVKNERDNLPACLDSAAGLADEIIVVDTGSSDGTQELARARGARVVQSDWTGDFSRARNLSLAEAKGAWILWLDADDRLLEEDRKAIRRLAEADPARSPKAYGFLIKNSIDGGRTGSVFNQIRLFPNRPDLRFRFPVHEQILPALEAAGLPVEYSDIRVLHTGYADPVLGRAKQVRNKEILEAQVKDNREVTPVTCFTLANACADLGLHAEAVGWYRKAWEMARSGGSNPHIAAAAPVKIAVSLASQKHFSEALGALEPALAAASGAVQPEAILVKAQLEEALGRPDAARPWFERLLDLRETRTFIPVDFQLLKIQALQFLGKYWYDRNRQDLAVSLLRSGLAIKQGRDFSGDDLAAAYRNFTVS
jgi:glycosyltransferase involved in cell wall biosynthesis